MNGFAISTITALGLNAGVGGCAPVCCGPEAEPLESEYLGVTRQRLGTELVSVVAGALRTTAHDADCAIAGHTPSVGQEFARHARMNFNEDTGNWQSDAVYSYSPMLPRGKCVFNAPVTTQNVPFRTHRRTEGMRNDG